MCGIAGYVGHGDKKLLVRMLDTISHRGPDDRGIYIDGNIGLGHNRLSIIDLSSWGHQPMFNEKGSICIIYNGEIYNFKNLKHMLKKKYVFKTQTDTEVILLAYEKWGVECLKYLNGMFAFVIYDKDKKILFGATDRIGEKPLRYYLSDNQFLFASEVKSILKVINKKPEIDVKAINDFLTLQYIPHPYTGFKNIFKLPPAHYFIYKNRKLETKRYWSLDFSEKLSITETEWKDLLIKKIEESVVSRMYSDVSLGALLSGGIDSSTVVAFMARNSKKRIKTFNIGFDNPIFDETKYALKVSKMYSTENEVIRVRSRDLIDNFDDVLNFFDEPIADNSILPTFLLSKLVRKHIKVVLTGDGGDENFGGYERYNVIYFSEFFSKVPKIIRNSLIKTFARSLYQINPSVFTERVLRFSETFDQPFYKKYLQYSCFFTNEAKYTLYSNEFRNKVIKFDTFKLFKNLYNKKINKFDNAFNFDFSYYLPNDLLYKSDIASMAHSLEIRSPLLNHELFELTAKMPFVLKIKYFHKKYILKKILEERNFIPDEIITRPKKGFIAPIDGWFKNELKTFVQDKILSKKMIESGIFDYQKLEEYLKVYYGSNSINANNIFALLSLSFWIGKHF